MRTREGHPYDNAIADELYLNSKVSNEFRTWCFKNKHEYSQGLLDSYLIDVGLDATIEIVGHKRWIWRINGIQYVNHKYRVNHNAHYSAIIHAIRIRQQILES